MKENPLNLWLGLLTAPFLVGYLGARKLGEWSIEMGRSSEEIFRGERLPALNFPGEPAANPED